MTIDSNPLFADVAWPAAEADARPTLLFVDPTSARAYVPALRSRFKVIEAATECEALQAIASSTPAFVVTELSLPEGNGLGVCREAKARSQSSSIVLVTTAAVDRIPLALAAGCDGVLLKPFAPNLFYARVGRLAREKNHSLLGNRVIDCARSADGVERSEELSTETDGGCTPSGCPACQCQSVVAFDHASYRREWYACLSCQSVWMAPRREDAL